jgi:hypothetical protein
MDHGYIDQFDLVDRYLMGKLTDEESARFEDHYVDCPQCFDRLKITRNFIRDLRSPAARESLKPDSYSRRRMRAYFAPLYSSRPLALAAGLLLFITVASAILLVNFIRRLQSDVNRARNEAVELRHSYEEAQQAASMLGRRLEEREQELTEQLRSLEARSQNNQEPPGDRAAESNLWIQPKINPLIFSLQSVKRGDVNRAGSVNELMLPASPAGFLISIGLESDVDYKDYRIIIVDNRDATVIKRNGFKRSPDNALSIGLNSKLFQPGDYLLTIEGITKEEDAIAVGNYPFHVVKKR